MQTNIYKISLYHDKSYKAKKNIQYICYYRNTSYLCNVMITQTLQMSNTQITSL